MIDWDNISPDKILKINIGSINIFLFISFYFIRINTFGIVF
ncbi:Hypothetical protein KK9_0864 [Borreliella garinii BgVir]|nr:Hypothetical protein KK9_0864 [Borreliella garinii BgVir]